MSYIYEQNACQQRVIGTNLLKDHLRELIMLSCPYEQKLKYDGTNRNRDDGVFTRWLCE